ncbi:beta-ketoacyl synthase N-terminal-like domain-containing protein [Kitasatospora sp. NPDC097643]|uniref:beta-ketoacyl synthase N-terminal-like domain-containing protein n=1 Tax=Kitasatospora sp. NPDC097643 TaxID=3157230 RepID=UPI003317BE22
MTAWNAVAESVVAGVGLVARPAGLPDGEVWFDYKARLGPRGYKYLPESCQYLLAAAREAQAGHPAGLAPYGEERCGVVVGTNSAVAALHAEIEQTVRSEGIGALSPMTTPFFSVNLVAAKLSTEYRLKGFNLTVTSPRVAGVEALHLAAHELAGGRGDAVLAGATEAADPHAGRAVPESGAAVFVLRPAGTAVPPGGAVLRTALRFLPPAALSAAAGRGRAEWIVRETLDALCAERPERPTVPVRLVTDGSPVAELVTAAVRAWAPDRVSVPVAAPHAGALAPVQLLAEGLRAADPGPRLVVTAAGPGNLAFALTSPAAAHDTPQT